MRKNRQSTKKYVAHHGTLSDSFDRFWIRIVWFQPKQDADRIRISFFKNRIGSDSKKALSDHICHQGSSVLFRVNCCNIGQDVFSYLSRNTAEEIINCLLGELL